MKQLILYYLINGLILLIWLPFLFSSDSVKSSSKSSIINVALIGCNLHSAILAHELKKHSRLNVTLLEEGECQFESQKHFTKSPAIVELFEQLNFKYKFVPNNLGFWDGSTLTTSETGIQNQFYRFGLSSYALKASLNKFDNWLKKCYKKPFNTIFECLERVHIKTTMSNAKYLLDEVGLDREYVRLIITPYIRGNQHDFDCNFLNLKLKLIEMFLPLVEFKGHQKDLGFRMLDGIKFFDEQKSVNISNRQKGRYAIATPQHNLTADFIVFCNYSDAKQWYFKTVVKGKLDPAYYSISSPSIPPLIYSNQNVVKIRKQCTVICTKAQSNLYVITSKARTTEKDLRMFKQYEVISWQRYKVPKLITNLRELPKITDGKGHFFMNSINSITDSKQFMVLMARNIVSLINQEAGG